VGLKILIRAHQIWANNNISKMLKHIKMTEFQDNRHLIRKISSLKQVGILLSIKMVISIISI